MTKKELKKKNKWRLANGKQNESLDKKRKQKKQNRLNKKRGRK